MIIRDDEDDNMGGIKSKDAEVGQETTHFNISTPTGLSPDNREPLTPESMTIEPQ